MGIPKKITIIVPMPVDSDYHSNTPKNPCRPMSVGKGCCGDCGDCFFKSVEDYARMLKKHSPMCKNKTLNQLVTAICENGRKD